MLPSSFFEILSNPIHFHFTVLSVVLFLWQNEWSRHTWCAILLNDNMDLHMSSLGTLVPEGPWCVFYVTRRQVYWGLTHNVVFTGTLIWYHTNTQTHALHSGASRLTHPYKYSTKSRAYFGHTGAREMLDSFIQTVHCDKFKQTWVAGSHIYKALNWTFVSVLLKCLRICRRICIEDIKWLILFCINSPLIWAPSLGTKPVYWHLKASGYITETYIYITCYVLTAATVIILND